MIGMDKMGNLAHTDHKTIIQTTITPYITVHGQHHKEAGAHLHARRVAREAKAQPKVKANIRHDRTIPKVKGRLRMTMAKDKPEKDNTMPKVGKAKDAGGNATIQAMLRPPLLNQNFPTQLHYQMPLNLRKSGNRTTNRDYNKN